MTAGLPDFSDVVAAAGRLGPHVVRTPVMRSDAFDARAGCQVFFKCENLQTGGAFKYRGAMNVLLQLDAARTPRGDHAFLWQSRQCAGARCARTRHACHRHHSARLRAFQDRGHRGGRCAHRIVRARPAGARADAWRKSWRASRPSWCIPSTTQRIIAGQGTAALEFLSEVPDLDVISTPVGGGGLIGGTALAARALSPRIRVIGAEPEQADDACQSFRSGERRAVNAPNTIADGLRGSIGVRNFELLRRLVDDVVTVSEVEIVAAMRVVLDDLKLLIEPSSAVPVAALLAGRLGRRVRVSASCSRAAMWTLGCVPSCVAGSSG